MDALLGNEVSGLLLCRKDGARVAFLAEQIARIEGENGLKYLRTNSGEGVGVDSVEVFADAVAVLPPPRLMLAGIGGSLYGFVSVSGALYPVLRVNEFARFLLHQQAGATP